MKSESTQKLTHNTVTNPPQDLTEIISLWPELPDHIKQTIKTLITASVKTKTLITASVKTQNKGEE